jgi:hypothetical protein
MSSTWARRGTPLLAGAAVLAVLAGSGYLFRGAGGTGPGGSGPPVLHLQSIGTLAPDSDPRWRVDGQLPTDGPDQATVRSLGRASDADVTDLARAAGLTGALRHVAGARTVGEGDLVLSVSDQDGSSWQLGPQPRCLTPDSPDGSGSSDGSVSSDGSTTFTCGPLALPPPSAGGTEPGSSGPGATTFSGTPGTDPGGQTGGGTSGSAGSGGSSGSGIATIAPEPTMSPYATGDPVVPSPPPTVPAVPEAQGRAVAAPVFDALHLDIGDAAVFEGSPATFTVDPTVDGLPTVGYDTAVSVTASRIVDARGLLGPVVDGHEYPVLSARAAYDRLTRTLMMRPMIACIAPPVKQDPMLCGGPLVVTGARFGLSMQYDGTSPLLVPSWLFDVKGSDRPIAQVAVDPAYLAPPSNPCGDGRECATPEPCNTCVTGAPTPVPMTATASPFTDEPVDPPLTPSMQPTVNDLLPIPAGILRVVEGTDHQSLEVTYGSQDDRDCRSLRPDTKETNTSVELVLTSLGDVLRPMDLRRTCKVTVQLSAPVGNRSVLDGRTGKVLLAR